MEDEKDDMYGSEDEDDLKYDPEGKEESPVDRFEEENKHYDTFADYKGVHEEDKDAEANKNFDDGSNTSGEEELEGRNQDKRLYEFNFDCPYPEFKEELTHVKDPIKAGHISYTVCGEDEDGEFEGIRRYRDFFSLRQCLVTRWPGILIPPIPPKQSVGNK